MHCLAKLFAVSSMLGLASCTTIRSHEEAAVAWSAPKQAAGRVLLLHQVHEVGDEATRQDKTQKVANAACEALRSTFGAEVIDQDALPASVSLDDGWLQKSDYELVMAAREADVQTLCLLDMKRCFGYLSIGFDPLPGWRIGSNISYHFRVLDVPTGKLLADTRRMREASRWLALGVSQSCADAFSADFRELLEQPISKEQ